MKLTIQTGILGLALAIAPVNSVFAQEAIVEGPGVQLGEGTVFHPSVSLETGVVSNVFYEDDNPEASGIARLVGAFSIATQTHQTDSEIEPAIESEDEPLEAPPPPAKVDFRLGGQVVLLGYLSDNEEVRGQSDVGVALNGDVIFLPHGDVSFRLTDDFVRDTRPRNFESTGNLNRDFNHFTAGFMVQPQGRTISAGARYENIVDRFESSGAEFANRLQHLIALRGEWRLFPYTKFFVDGSYGFFGSLGDNELGGMRYHSGSNPLRVQAGVGTALTEVTTFRAYVGYGNGFYDTGPNFSNAIGGAEFGYRYTEYGRLRLIADYNFHDSLQANFFRDYSFMADLSQQFGLFVAGADAGVRIRAYRGISPVIGEPDRDDVILFGSVRLAYLLRDWLAITGRVEATVDQTDYTYMAGVGGTDSPEYQRYEAFLGVSAAF